MYENMYPQLGQGASDHSVVFSDLLGRIKRSKPQIARSVYGPDAEKIAIKVRNYHVPLVGTVQDGSKYDGTPYRGLDPETFYWAHATFVDFVMMGVDLFIKRLSPAEREQMFQESRRWYSMWGVDDSAQPSTYAEFTEYWNRVVEEDLIGDSRIAQFSVGFIEKGLSRGLPKPPSVPDVVWKRLVSPVIDAGAAFLGAGMLDPVVRERLGVAWTPRQKRRFQRMCATVRALSAVYDRLPLGWRYDRIAVDAFKREGIAPNKITVASAAAALAAANAA